jgi:lysophospholipid acyltransferase (LPLAT)-like uncharacterized protein
MSPFVKSILATSAFHRFLYHFIRIYSGTFRIGIENEAQWRQLIDEGTPALLCAWHQQFFAAIRPFKRYARYQPALMISRSRDGAIIAAVARQTGWKTVRGSSSRGGKLALRSMIRHLEHFKLAGHILDGPTGPIGVVKTGAIRLAHAAKATVVPFSVSAHRALYFNSWDRFMLPLPFSRVSLRFGNPVRFVPTNDSQAFERQRVQLETMMAPYLSTGRRLTDKGS